MNIIAIDCGASFIKGICYDSFTGSFGMPEIQKTPEYGKQKAGIHETIEIVKKMINRLSLNEEEVQVGFSTEMHGFLLADKNGNALTDYISWKDERANRILGKRTYVEEVCYLLEEDEILHTGMPVKAGLPSVNLFYQLKNDFKTAEKQSLYFYTLGDYLIRTLSGKEPQIHITNAAATGLCDLRTCQWNEKLIKKLGMQGIHLPKITTQNKKVEGRLGGKKVFFYPAIGDQQAALLGSEFKGEKNVSLNFGTGAQVSILRKQAVFSEKYQVRPYFNNSYLYTIPHIPSGRALNVYFNFVKQIVNSFTQADDNVIWEYILKETAKDTYGSMEIDMSFFTNAVTKKCVGSIGNVEEDKFTVGNLFHSVYKQIAVNARQMADVLSNDKFDVLYFSGGVVRKNRILREFMLKEFEAGEYIIAENETLKGICNYILQR